MAVTFSINKMDPYEQIKLIEERYGKIDTNVELVSLSCMNGEDITYQYQTLDTINIIEFNTNDSSVILTVWCEKRSLLEERTFVPDVTSQFPFPSYSHVQSDIVIEFESIVERNKYLRRFIIHEYKLVKTPLI